MYHLQENYKKYATAREIYVHAFLLAFNKKKISKLSLIPVYIYIYICVCVYWKS